MPKIKIPKIIKNIQNVAKSLPAASSLSASPMSLVEPFVALNEMKSSQGRAIVKKSAQKVTKTIEKVCGVPIYTQEQVEKILKNFLNNDDCKIQEFQAIFSNLEKLDYDNIVAHIKNIKIFMSGASNFKEQVVENGYFSSKKGAQAFEALAEILSPKSSNFRVSPLSIALGEFKPDEVLTLKKRGLLTPDKIENYSRLNKLAKMGDKEFEDFFARAQKSIENTGLSFEQLRLKVIEQLPNPEESYVIRHIIKNSINEESVVAQLETLNILKNYPIDFSDSSLSSLLNIVNIDNIESCKKILHKLPKRPDISASSVIDLVDISNKNTEKIISDLIDIEDVPLEKIVKYCQSAQDFSKDEILKQINSDNFVQTSRVLRNGKFDLKPSNVTQKPLNPRGIDEDSLVLVHMTKYEPENGVILSTRDKLGGSRNSVHFTLNHPVASHRGGNWDEFDCAVIMPYSATKKVNPKGKFIEGMPNDLYTNGSVEVPKGSIFVKRNSELANGEIKVSQHPTLDGVKVVETSLYPHEITPCVIEKMGYTHLEADGPIGMFSYGRNKGVDVDEALKNYAFWDDFCKTQGIKPTRHTGSVGDIAEKLIENIGMLAYKNTWTPKNACVPSYKTEILKTLDTIKTWQNKGYFASYDLDKLKEIVKNSHTPKVALDAIQKELGFHPTIKYDYFSECSLDNPLDIYVKWINAMESPKVLRECFEDELRYI